MRGKSLVKWDGLFIFLLLTVVAGLDGCYSARLSRAIAAYQARGEPIEPVDFRVSPVHDDQNRADALLNVAAPTTRRSKVQEDDIDAIISGYVLKPEEMTRLRSWLTASLPRDAELNTILARPSVRWPVPLIGPTGTIDTSHLDGLRALSNTLRADAQLALLDHDTARVMVRLDQMIRLAETSGTDTTFIGVMVSTGLDASACDLVFSGPETLSGEQAKPVIAALLDDAGRDGRIVDSMRVERANMLATARGIVSSASLLKQPLIRILLYREAPQYFKINDLGTAAMIEHNAAKLAAIHAQTLTISSGRGVLLAGILAPSYGRGAELMNRLRTDRRIAATILAARAFAHEHGSPPPSLAALVPNYLIEVPRDPYDPAGGPLRYLPATGLVYSAGKNQVDDAGNLTPPPTKSSYPDPWSAPDYGHTISPPPPTTRPVEDPDAG